MNTVSIHIVIYCNSGYIDECLQAVFDQKYRIEQVIIDNNASTDGTLKKLVKWSDQCIVAHNAVNNGFAGGHLKKLKAGKMCKSQALRLR
ncbi:glycosyltransferase [Gorillibacterium massiliense]|uniref:glycosyltransferase n=1 Tax=Gorillibacterium massiliense TaxID=1280390 RepID=UPI000592C7D4|nr:glycosyltransferase [Gorillibacterium massiliense]